MPDSNELYRRVRRFLAVAQRVLGLVLLVLEILKRWLDLTK